MTQHIHIVNEPNKQIQTLLCSIINHYVPSCPFNSRDMWYIYRTWFFCVGILSRKQWTNMFTTNKHAIHSCKANIHTSYKIYTTIGTQLGQKYTQTHSPNVFIRKCLVSEITRCFLVSDAECTFNATDNDDDDDAEYVDGRRLSAYVVVANVEACSMHTNWGLARAADLSRLSQRANTYLRAPPSNRAMPRASASGIGRRGNVANSGARSWNAHWPWRSRFSHNATESTAGGQSLCVARFECAFGLWEHKHTNATRTSEYRKRINIATQCRPTDTSFGHNNYSDQPGQWAIGTARNMLTKLKC